MKKKIMPLLLILVLLLTGCARMVPDATSLTVYASFYPIYVLARGITQNVPDLVLRCLTQPQDGCPRSYALSTWDGALLATADALLLGGQGLEAFSADLTASGIPTVALLDGLTLHQTRAAAPEADEANHFAGPSPWLWLSPDGAAQLYQAVAVAMTALDPRYEALYQQNLADMTAQLRALQRDMAQLIAGTTAQPVGVLHEGMTYLCEALNLPIALTIEREPGADYEGKPFDDAVTQLRAAGVRVLLIEHQAPQRLTDALTAAGFSLALIDTLTAHTQPSPDTYCQAMRQNTRAVAEALERA